MIGDVLWGPHARGKHRDWPRTALRIVRLSPTTSRESLAYPRHARRLYREELLLLQRVPSRKCILSDALNSSPSRVSILFRGVLFVLRRSAHLGGAPFSPLTVIRAYRTSRAPAKHLALCPRGSAKPYTQLTSLNSPSPAAQRTPSDHPPKILKVSTGYIFLLVFGIAPVVWVCVYPTISMVTGNFRSSSR